MASSKAIKSIAFSVQAESKHNSVKINNLIKWLKSGHEVRVDITGKADRFKAIEALYKDLESEIHQGAKFTQKIIKPDSMRFVLKPTKDIEKIVEKKASAKSDNDDEILNLREDVDIFSREFEAELTKSIKEERNKNKKK